MKNISVPTKRGVLLNGALFGGGAETVVIAITGIHGNFCSNPFYYNFGDTLNSGGIDFIYAQTCDAFGKIETEYFVNIIEKAPALAVRRSSPILAGAFCKCVKLSRNFARKFYRAGGSNPLCRFFTQKISMETGFFNPHKNCSQMAL